MGSSNCELTRKNFSLSYKMVRLLYKTIEEEYVGRNLPPLVLIET